MPGPLTFDLNAQRARGDIGDALGLAARPQMQTMGAPGSQGFPMYAPPPPSSFPAQGAGQQMPQGWRPPTPPPPPFPGFLGAQPYGPQGAPGGAPPAWGQPGAMPQGGTPPGPINPQLLQQLLAMRPQGGAAPMGAPQNMQQGNQHAALLAQLMQHYGQH